MTVTRLQVAPVKALACVPRQQVTLERDGIAEDRRLMLLRRDGSVVTLRQHPRLAQVVPELDLENGRLAVTLPASGPVTSALEPVGPVLRTRLFGKDREGRAVPGDVADALSEFLGERVDLVLADRTGVGWDEDAVSLVGAGTPDAVGAPAEDGGPAWARFRMTIEVDGVEAFAEDGWVGSRLRAGGAEVEVTRPLGRCVVIDHDPGTGAKDWDGLRVLARLRGVDRITLGVVCKVTRTGDVRVGDPVEVTG